ncbi:hypothetical protein AncyloWKF20_10695 [Ancylobacter sp. WKF20]|uniref:hypothetical protein n=1 Tax=Ancylobacter sp. WKF20 TaxID=3039801 RepID=UPI0024345E00|nr:hypothetical protein [Ancylobacter sp. WKF20]WGD32250.1 hypothetical protein AncyloWKF20_10695 [Ancylobacter sp. WKF20]
MQTRHLGHLAVSEIGFGTMKSGNVKAIVAFEPGSGFVFPEGEVPAPIPTSFDTIQGVPVPLSDFLALTPRLTAKSPHTSG